MESHGGNTEDAWGGTCDLLKDPRWDKYVDNPHCQDAIDDMKELLSIDNVYPPFYLDYDRITTQPGSLNGRWNADGMIRNALMIIPAVTGILFAGEQGISHLEGSMVVSEERKKLTNYIARFHAMFEMMYPSTQKIHPAINLEHGLKFNDGHTAHMGKYPIIGAVIYVVHTTNVYITRALLRY